MAGLEKATLRDKQNVSGPQFGFRPEYHTSQAPAVVCGCQHVIIVLWLVVPCVDGGCQLARCHGNLVSGCPLLESPDGGWCSQQGSCSREHGPGSVQHHECAV